MAPTARRQLGDAGEREARRLLEAAGYAFVAANWHCAAGELDLVMQDGAELVFGWPGGGGDNGVEDREAARRGRVVRRGAPGMARGDLAGGFVRDHPRARWAGGAGGARAKRGGHRLIARQGLRRVRARLAPIRRLRSAEHSPADDHPGDS